LVEREGFSRASADENRNTHQRQAEHDQPERKAAGQTRIDRAFVRPAR
jgi:hypothetical protein